MQKITGFQFFVLLNPEMKHVYSGCTSASETDFISSSGHSAHLMFTAGACQSFFFLKF